MTIILQDVYRQIDRLRKLDSGSSDSKITWKYIADFKDEMARMISLDKFLLFEHLNGLERGQQILIFKEKLIAQYGHLADMPTNILKGKNLSRIFWAIIKPDNLDEIEGFIKAKE